MLMGSRSRPCSGHLHSAFGPSIRRDAMFSLRWMAGETSTTGNGCSYPTPGRSILTARLTTFVDVSSDPNIVGVPQVRQVRFAGDMMVLSPPIGYRGQSDVHGELTWKRMA